VTVDISKCIAFVERELTPQRFKHSLGVMNVMGELSSVYALDETTALLCGILHDVAKEFPLERQLEIARKNNIQLVTEYDRHPLFLHGPVGACYIAEELDITAPVIRDALMHHSYLGNGTALSPLLCWCRKRLKPVVYSGNVQEGAYRLMEWAIAFHESTAVPVHPNMRRVFHELSALRDNKTSSGSDPIPV
jgi:hypothetical protein